MSTQTVDAIHGLEYRTIETEIRSFSGLRNVFRRFGPKIAHVVALLDKNLSIGQEQTFDVLQED